MAFATIWAKRKPDVNELIARASLIGRLARNCAAETERNRAVLSEINHLSDLMQLVLLTAPLGPLLRPMPFVIHARNAGEGVLISRRLAAAVWTRDIDKADSFAPQAVDLATTNLLPFFRFLCRAKELVERLSAPIFLAVPHISPEISMAAEKRIRQLRAGGPRWN
jgi:hypothetical protein